MENIDINELIDKSVGTEGSHHDVAHVVAKYFLINGISMIQYSGDSGCWYKYENGGWRMSRETCIFTNCLSEGVYDLYKARANYWRNKEGDEADKKEYNKKREVCDTIAVKLKNTSYKSSIFAELKGFVENPKIESLMNSQGHLLRFENGVYDFKSSVFRDGRPEDYMTFITGCTYVAYDESLPYINDVKTFIKNIFQNEDDRRYALYTIASCLNGCKKEDSFFILNGSGSNGKSKLCSFIAQAFGTYYGTLPVALLTQKRTKSNEAQSELVRTAGRRIVVSQEPDAKTETLNCGIMKELTGGDSILCRGLFKESIEFKPQFKLFMCCNDLPDIHSDDGGTWRRIKSIEFRSKFVDDEPRRANEIRKDMTLDSDKFALWASTFMSWLIEILKDKKPEVPESVIRSTLHYKMKSDTIGSFVATQIKIAGEKNTTKTTLTNVYNKFKTWVRDSHIDIKIKNKTDFEEDFMRIVRGFIDFDDIDPYTAREYRKKGYDVIPKEDVYYYVSIVCAEGVDIAQDFRAWFEDNIECGGEERLYYKDVVLTYKQSLLGKENIVGTASDRIISGFITTELKRQGKEKIVGTGNQSAFKGLMKTAHKVA